MSTGRGRARDVPEMREDGRHPEKAQQGIAERSTERRTDTDRARRRKEIEALNPTQKNFMSAICSQLQLVGHFDFTLSLINNTKPRDYLETLLVSQMAAIHVAIMNAAARLDKAESLAEHDSFQQALNKLARSYANQMEVLTRRRLGGEQKVTVQHVNVSNGGQAIVGHVTQGQTESRSSRTAADAAPKLTEAKRLPMRSLDGSRPRIRAARRRGATP